MSVIEEILKSDSFSSLNSERDIALKINKAGWSSVHGFYFKDLETGKNRELDVAAEKYWKKTISRIEIRASVLLLMEVKTMRGFHLFISEKDDSRSHPLLQHLLWSGDSSEKYQDLINAVSDFTLTTAEVNKVVKSLNHYAYPNGYMRRPIASAQVRPFATTIFNAFRENNIGSEKNLDNSVFWKASESLRSAFVSIEYEWNIGFLDSVKMHFEMAKRHSKNWLIEAIKWSKEELNIVRMVHPVIFTDAQIWRIDSATAVELPFARFAMQNSLYSAEWWCDVVNSNHIDDYLDRLSKHYDRTMFKSNAFGFESSQV